jgi:hypothetical protein
MERIWLEEQSNYQPYEYDPEFKTIDFRSARGKNKRTYHINFMMGIISRVRQRLEEMSETRQMHNPDLKALTINLASETKSYVSQLYPSLTSHISGYQHDPVGYANGFAAGNRVSVVRPGHHVDGGPLRLTGGN